MNNKELLNTLVLTLVKESGSDIHIVSKSSPIVRIQGDLIVVTRMDPMKPSDVLEILKEMINDEQFDKLIKNKQLDFAYTHLDEYRMRGNAFFQNGEISISLRLISKVKNLKDLSLPDILLELSRKKQGFFLVVGPVGQGKSTTLASMIDHINQFEKKLIVTIEDPIEYIYENKNSIIMQREVGFDALDFNSALVSSLRQDIDVILIGEMRDAETMRAAVTAAETGHLVFSTLHTNSASQTIDRIIDSFPAEQQDQIRNQLASSLIGIFSQRLLPKVGGGQIPAYELLISNSAVQNLIREKRTFELDHIIETGGEQGMVSMDRCLSDLVRRGEIPVDVAIKYAKYPNILSQMI
ncbi:MAG: twitching motility protein PilT [Patescibacteria group bacterium]|nr:twitching motility protein PilT [Patescibacteria group bacterium]